MVELSAQCIHAPIHRISGARVVMHTHQTWALALNMLKDNRLLPASQTAAFFHGHVAYDDNYTGTADSLEEGERLARVIGDKHVLFMKNHGVLVTGDTVAQAYRRLYKLERVCRAQVLAMSTGKPLETLSDEIVAQVQAPPENDRHQGRARAPLLRGDDAHPRPRNARLRRLDGCVAMDGVGLLWKGSWRFWSQPKCV